MGKAFGRRAEAFGMEVTPESGVVNSPGRRPDMISN